ncbi:hypothetical protein LCGC14_2605470 [marine sediment metagenome]|uniref:Uncharacterized protein n=1 Tax=marine sediment metagenome TaxID=412755 RepID=A0A0F9CIG2_9ZZZZ
MAIKDELEELIKKFEELEKENRKSLEFHLKEKLVIEKLEKDILLSL